MKARRTKSKSPAKRAEKRNAKKPNSVTKQQELHTLLQKTQEDLEHIKKGIPLVVPDDPVEKDPALEVKGDEHFLLLFFEHVSYQPRTHVDLSGWGSELSVTNMNLTEKLDRTFCKSILFKGITFTSTIIQWLSTFPSLKFVGLDSCHGVGPKLPSFIKKCHSVRGLGLSNCSLTDRNLMLLADVSERRLNHIDFSYNPKLSDEGIDYIAERCDKLEHVRLSGLPRLRDASLVGSVGSGGLLPTHGSRLKSLDIEACEGITDESISSLFTHVHDVDNKPKLVSFNLSFLPRITDEALRPLIDIHDVSSWFVGDLELGRKRLNPLKTVKEANLSGCPMVSGAAISYLSYGCTNLTKIEMSDGVLFDDKALGALRSLVHLSDITAERLPSLTHRGVLMLLEGGDGNDDLGNTQYMHRGNDNDGGGEGIDNPSLIHQLLHLRLGECENILGAKVIQSVGRAEATREILTLEIGNTCSIPAHGDTTGGLGELGGLSMLNSQVENIDAEMLKKLCCNCTDLTKLDICGVPAVLNKQSLYTLSARLRKNLTSLNIGRCELDFADAFNPLRAMKPKLKFLNIANSPYLPDGIAAHFPISLTALDVSGCSKISNLFLENLHRSCPNLVDLNVAECPSISDSGVIPFLEHRPPADLEEVALFGKTHVRLGTLERFSCQGTNISDSALDSLAMRTISTSLLAADDDNEPASSEITPAHIQGRDDSLPCLVLGRKENTSSSKDTHCIVLKTILYDLDISDMNAKMNDDFKNHIAEVIEIEPDSISIISCSAGSVILETNFSGFRNIHEAEAIVAKILSKQSELLSVHDFGRYKVQSISTQPIDPTSKFVSFPTTDQNNIETDMRRTRRKTSALQEFRGIQPIGGSEAAMARRVFMTQCADRDQRAPQLQKWARQRLSVKRVYTRYRLECKASKCIQQVYRKWHARQFFIRALKHRLKAVRIIQRTWKNYLNLRQIWKIIAGFRCQIQGRAFAALRESIRNTQKRADRVSAVVHKRRQRVWLVRWHKEMINKRIKQEAIAEAHYAKSILFKMLNAWYMNVNNSADRRKALAVVFLTATADLLVHFNSSRQLQIAPLGEYHWKRVFGPKHLRAWSKVAKAQSFLKHKVDRLVYKLVTRWRPWARDRVRWKENEAKMLNVRKQQVVKHLHLWVQDCEIRREKRHKARLHFLRRLKFTSYQAIAAIAEAARQALAERVRIAEERIVWPRKLRYMQQCIDEWIKVTAYKKQGRLAATEIQIAVRAWLERRKADAEAMLESKNMRKAERYWKKRRYPQILKLRKWAAWRAKYHPLADYQAYKGPLKVTLKAWRLAHLLERGAIVAQRIVRGFLARRWTHNFIMNREWAAMTISKSLRAAMFRRNLTNVHRLRLRIIALQDVARAMIELDEMAKEDTIAYIISRNTTAAIRIQNIYRGLLGKRRWQDELGRAVLERAAAEKEAQLEWKRKAMEAARLREIELQHVIKMAIRVQNAWRTRNARKLLSLILTFNSRTKVATLLQSGYRGRIGRRIGFGRRRHAALKLKVLQARTLESSLLRSMGIMRRRYAGPLRLGQTTARRWMRNADLSPLNFSSVRTMRRELREDFLDARHAVICRIELLRTDGIVKASKMRIPKRVENKFYLTPGHACQVILLGHPLHAYTGFVLSVDTTDPKVQMAEVRMDSTGAVHFLPIRTEEKRGQPSEQVLISIPTLAFTHIAKVSKLGVRNRWRNDLISYASKHKETIREGRRAVIIQCAFRQYQSRSYALQLREEAGIKNAVRCEQASRTLRRYGIYNNQGAKYLSLWYWAWYGLYYPHLPGIRVPPDLPSKPTKQLQRLDERKRANWREQEARELSGFLERRPEYYGGEGFAADRLVESGMPDDEVPINLKAKMPYRRFGKFRKWYWKHKYYKKKQLSSHHSGLSGDVGLEAGFKGDGFSQQPFGIRVHDESFKNIFGFSRNKLKKKKNKHEGQLIGKKSSTNRSDLLTMFHPHLINDGGSKVDLVYADNGAVYHRAQNVNGRDKREAKHVLKEGRKELNRTGATHLELAQLKTLPYTTSDGWAVVHGVYNKGQPDGWSVVHLLTGKRPESKSTKASAFTIGSQYWTNENSIEMALQNKTKKAKISRRAAAVRRALQVEIRQLRLEDTRLKEGRIKYAARTEPTNKVEDELMSACTLLQRLEQATAKDLAPVVAEEEFTVGPMLEAMERVAAADHRVREILRHVSPADHPNWPTEGKCPDSDEDESLTKEPIVLLKKKIDNADVQAATAAADNNGVGDQKSKLTELSEDIEPYDEALDVAEAEARAQKWAYHYGPYLVECFENFGLACSDSLSGTIPSSATTDRDSSDSEDEEDQNADEDEEAAASAAGMSFTRTSSVIDADTLASPQTAKKDRLKPELRCNAYPVLTRGATRFGRSRKMLTALSNKDGGKWKKPKSIFYRLFTQPPDDEEEEETVVFEDYECAEGTAWREQKELEAARKAMERDIDIHPYHFKIVGMGRHSFKLVTRPGATCYLEGKLVSLATSGHGRSFPIWDGARIVIGKTGFKSRTFIFRDDPKFYPPVNPSASVPPPQVMNPRFIRAPSVPVGGGGGGNVEAEGLDGQPAAAPVQVLVMPPKTPPAWVRCERQLNPSPAPPPPPPVEVVPVEEDDPNASKKIERPQREERVNPNLPVSEENKEDEEGPPEEDGYGNDEVEFIEGMAEIGRNRKAAMVNASVAECVHGDLYHGIPAVMATTHMRRQISEMRPEDTSFLWGDQCKIENRKRLELMVGFLVGSRQSTKTLLETLGALVRSCEAKVEAITTQIADNDKIRKDKTNPKYMRERAKDERKKLIKEALPESEAAYAESKVIFDKKKAEAEALIAHLEELVAAAEVGDAEAVAYAERETEWANCVAVRVAVEKRNEASLQRQRNATQRLVIELHDKVAQVRLFDQATADRKKRIQMLHHRLVSMQKAEHDRRATQKRREERIAAKKQEEADIRKRNLKIDRLQRLVRAGWIPSTRVQEAVDKMTQDASNSAELEKEAKRADRKKELQNMLGKLGAAASKVPLDEEDTGPFIDIASQEEERGRPDQRTKMDYEAWTEPLDVHQKEEEGEDEEGEETGGEQKDGEVAGDGVADNTPGEAEAAEEENAEARREFRTTEERTISTIRCNLRGGHIHGLVSIEFIDGSEFFGPWDDSLRRPIDSVILPQEDELPASWQRDHAFMPPLAKHHPRNIVLGSWKTPDGVIWESEVINISFDPTKASGLFTIKTPHGEFYDGHISRGKPNGFGRKKFKDSQPLGGFFEGEYIGEWRDGMRHGKGTCILANEEMYQGDWKCDWMDGEGKQTFPDGSTYEGTFQRSRWHGHGERRLSNGDIYTGGFKGGQMNGYGELKYADGAQYFGEWLNSKRHGKGLFITNQNERYDGSWDSDDLHGQVTWHGRQAPAKGMPSEPVSRDAEYDHGVRLHWLSAAITASSTKAFVQFFCEIERVDAQRREKFTLVDSSFALEYATLASVMMPQPPPGVDPSNAAVKLIMHKICSSHTLQPFIGQTIEERLDKFALEANQQLEEIDAGIEAAEAHRQDIVSQWRYQKGVVNSARKDLKECRKRIAFNIKTIRDWWNMDKAHVATNRPPGGPPVDIRFEESTVLFPKKAREDYHDAVEMLKTIPPIEWKRLRSKCLGKQLPRIAEMLLENLCILYDHPADHESVLLLLSGAEYNLIHVPYGLNHGFMAGQLPIGAPSTAAAKYETKAVNLLPWWQVYDWANIVEEPERLQKLKTIARNVVHNPRMDAKNTKLIEAGVPLPPVVTYIQAAHAYASACAHVYQNRQDLYISRSEARYKLETVQVAEAAEEALQSEMRASYEALRTARAPWVDAWARVQALKELSLEVYHFRLLATEKKAPDPVIMGPPVAVASLGYKPNPAELVNSRPDMQHESTRQFVGKAQKRLARLQDLANESAKATPLMLIENIKKSEGEAELLNAVMALDDQLTGRNDTMAAALEEMSEREVADLRSSFVSAMVKLQVDDKEVDADPLDHTWSALVEKCYYETQRNFEAFSASRPRRLFLDYIGALEKATTPPEFALALEECNWWCKQNVPQDQTLWHEDYGVYVEEISNTLTACLEKNPRLLAPDAKGQSVTIEPHKEMLDELNRYKGFNVESLWWSKLGDWQPVYNDEDGEIAHYERYVEPEEGAGGGEEGEEAQGSMEYSYEYPVPPEPGREDEYDEFGYDFGEEGEGVQYDENGEAVVAEYET